MLNRLWVILRVGLYKRSHNRIYDRSHRIYDRSHRGLLVWRYFLRIVNGDVYRLRN